MQFLLDHDVPVEIARVLRQAGHEVVTVEEALTPVARDAEVFDYAAQESLLLVTCNRDDFLELAKDRTHAGLIILIRRRTRIAECASLIRLVERAKEQGIAGNVNFA